jgi:hypothetical protein
MGQAAPLFELAEPSFDGVALGVAGGVEADRSAAGGALAAAIGLLVVGLGDGVTDAAAAQQRPVDPGAVGLVREQVVRAGARPAPADPRDPDGVEQRHERPAVVHVSAGEPVSRNASTRPWPSVRACTLVVSPPRERPIA